MRFPRQEFWCGLSVPFPGDLLDPGVKPGCPTLRADSFLSEPAGKPNSCGLWDLVPWPGIKSGLPTLGAWSLSHWTTGEWELRLSEVLREGTSSNITCPYKERERCISAHRGKAILGHSGKMASASHRGASGKGRLANTLILNLQNHEGITFC